MADRRTRALLALAFALVAAGCVSETRDASGQIRRGDPPPDAVRIVMQDNAFVPDSLTTRPGDEVVLDVVNEGRAPHNLVIDEVGLSTGTMPAGDAVVAAFTMPDGPVEFVCTFHPGMDGTIAPTG